jgi:hypothetical protein
MIGSVYRGNWDGTLVALKQLKSAEQFEEFAREASLLEYFIENSAKSNSIQGY